MSVPRLLWFGAAAAGVLGAALLLVPDPPDPPLTLSSPNRFITQPPTPGERTEPSPSVAAASPPSAARPGPPDTSAAAPAEQWRPVIAGFTRELTNTSAGGHPAWLRRISQWTSDYLTRQYQHTAAARIPTGTLVGLDVVTADATVVDFIARYDTGLTLAGRVERGPAGWKVTTVEPVQPAAGGRQSKSRSR